ncbi:hypothetical protein TKK_0017304 [Trichogramma kaykai]|uniref:F-box domain-containing protein n=1 Tax=Trichogramma kaykai TaxID=54128 RepID=A0ABD2W2S1_9HYME
MKRSATSSHSSDDESKKDLEPIAKKSKNNFRYEYHFLDLPDDVLLHVCNLLSAFDKIALHLTCTRLSNLCCDRFLWKKIDFRGKNLTVRTLKLYSKFILPITKFLAIRGNTEIDAEFFDLLRQQSRDLKEFIVEDYIISQQDIPITSFPKTLKLLSLKGCDVINRSPLLTTKYLSRIDSHMLNLSTLILSNCKWLNSHSFMIISKIQQLKEVRLNSCHGLKEDIAYTSIACRCGMKNLEILDLRDTFVGDSVITSFSLCPTLTEIYMENPSPESEPYHHEPPPEHREIFLIQLPRGPNINQNNVAVNVGRVNDIDANRLMGYIRNNVDRSLITDRSVCSLGIQGRNPNIAINHLEEVQLAVGRSRETTNPNLQKLVVRNYPDVTNNSLTHLLHNAPKLVYLDVTGTSVTKQAVDNFRLQRPEVTLLSSF